MCIQPFVLLKWLNGNTPPNARPHNLARQHAGFRTNDRAALHPNVVTKAHLSADYAIILDGHTSADSGLRRDHYALADIAVVPHMDHVVEFSSFANPGTTERPAIDGGIRAQFNIIFNGD